MPLCLKHKGIYHEEINLYAEGIKWIYHEEINLYAEGIKRIFLKEQSFMLKA